MVAKHKKHRGSSLDAFLEKEGVLDEFSAIAEKEVIAWQFAEAMKEQGLSKVSMAAKMKTSRTQVDRLLDPKSGNVTLTTMRKAARVLGKKLSVDLA